MEVVCKLSEARDFDQLWPLVEESLAGEPSRLSRNELQQDLFGTRELKTELLASLEEDPAIELDPDQARLTYPIRHAITAQVDGQLVGYLTFHQDYSPWQRRGVCVEIVYVKPAYRRKGIAKSLFKRLEQYKKQEVIAYLFYESTRLDSAMKETLKKYGGVKYRDEDSNWSVYRINI